MNKWIGILMFAVAAGMLIMLLLDSTPVGIILIGIFLLIGYNIIICCRK